MNVRRALWALLAAAALSLALSSSAHAAKAVHVSCGQTITADTKLANDLTDCPGNGIVIGADGITLDLNGHTIDGDGTAVEGCPLDEYCNTGIVNSANDGGRPVAEGSGHDGVTIMNGSIQGFSEMGVGASGVSDNRVRALTVSDNLWGVALTGAVHSRIEHITAEGNGLGAVVDCGVGAVECSHDIQIEHSSFSGNAYQGISVGESLIAGIDPGRPQDVRIEHNTVAETTDGFAGILVSEADHVVVSHNSVSHNAGFGIVLNATDDNLASHNHVSHNLVGISGSGNRNTIIDNQVSDGDDCPDDPLCGVGISLETGTGNLVMRNDVRRMPSDGILVDGFDPETPTLDSVVRDNRVRDAGVDGFSVATAVDGTVSGTLIEGNVAIGSGDDGFDVRSAATTLTRNTANDNFDLGIEAVPGVIDGGGNKAHGNGNPLQCTNIFCR